MPRTHPAYAPDYRRRIIELARTGRPLAQLAGALEASAMRSVNGSSRPDSMKLCAAMG